jgi:hypothetical protein
MLGSSVVSRQNKHKQNIRSSFFVTFVKGYESLNQNFSSLLIFEIPILLTRQIYLVIKDSPKRTILGEAPSEKNAYFRDRDISAADWLFDRSALSSNLDANLNPPDYDLYTNCNLYFYLCTCTYRDSEHHTDCNRYPYGYTNPNGN